MKLSKRELLAGSWPGTLGFINSRFAAYPHCSPSLP
jgi:hypothetical protein